MFQNQKWSHLRLCVNAAKGHSWVVSCWISSGIRTHSDGEWTFYDLHMRNKNRCSLRHWVIGSVAWLCFPPPRLPLLTPYPSHPSSLFTNVAVIYSHSIYYCCTLQEGESWPFSLASSRIVKLIYWKYQSAGWEGEPRQIYVTSVCTLPPRGRGLQLQEDRPERLDECTELWVAGIQMQRGPSALNFIKSLFFLLLLKGPLGNENGENLRIYVFSWIKSIK